jgi:hypothetical protein
MKELLHRLASSGEPTLLWLLAAGLAAGLSSPRATVASTPGPQPSPFPAEPASSSESRAAFPERLTLPGPVRVPLSRADSRPEVFVLIEGEGPFRLVFDTGASGLMLLGTAIDALDLREVGRGFMSSPLGEGFDVPRVRIERMSLGAAVLHGVLADRWDGPPLFSEPDPPVGIIGPSLFRDALLTLDFEHAELRLEEGRLTRGEPGVIPFGDDHYLPLFQLNVAGVVVPAHLDSGNSAALILPLEAGVSLVGEPVLAGRARLVDAEVPVYSSRVDGTVRLGSWSLESPSVLLMPGAPAGNLGIGLLRGVSLTLDQRSRLARITGSTPDLRVLRGPRAGSGSDR